MRVPLRDRIPSRGRFTSWCKASLRRTAPALIAAAIGAVIATGGVYAYRWVTSSPRFALAEIVVQGNSRRSTAGLQRRSELSTGENLFRIDTTQVEQLIERDPWIKTAEVSRRLPNRLIVEVVERKAALVVQLTDLYLADADGKIFKRAAIEQGEGAGLPVLTGLARQQYLSDSESAQAAVRRALTTLTQYNAVPERPRIGEISIDAQDELTLHTYDTALAIRVGNADSEVLRQRLRAFDAAWGSLEQDERNAAQVLHADNATHPDRVTVRFRRAKVDN